MIKSLSIALFFTAVLGMAQTNYSPTLFKEKIILIDAGHGGEDKGAFENGVTEKEITLAIAREFIKYNTGQSMRFELVRNNEQFMSLEERSLIINNSQADLVISLHVNSAKNASNSGLEAYVPKSDYKQISTQYAEELLANLENVGFPIRNSNPMPANFHLLKNSEKPILVLELGFLSNANDRAMLLDEAKRNLLVQTIVQTVGKEFMQ